MGVKCYQDLIFWKKSVALADEIYVLTGKMPKHEGIGLVSQMRRAAVSVASNIAEGAGRITREDYMFFLGIARASGTELETQIRIASKAYSGIDFRRAQGLLTEVLKMLNKTISTVRSHKF